MFSLFFINSTLAIKQWEDSRLQLAASSLQNVEVAWQRLIHTIRLTCEFNFIENIYDRDRIKLVHYVSLHLRLEPFCPFGDDSQWQRHRIVMIYRQHSMSCSRWRDEISCSPGVILWVDRLSAGKTSYFVCGKSPSPTQCQMMPRTTPLSYAALTGLLDSTLTLWRRWDHVWWLERRLSDLQVPLQLTSICFMLR